jgi:hypothetical protein
MKQHENSGESGGGGVRRGEVILRSIFDGGLQLHHTFQKLRARAVLVQEDGAQPTSGRNPQLHRRGQGGATRGINPEGQRRAGHHNTSRILVEGWPGASGGLCLLAFPVIESLESRLRPA